MFSAEVNGFGIRGSVGRSDNAFSVVVDFLGIAAGDHPVTEGHGTFVLVIESLGGRDPAHVRSFLFVGEEADHRFRIHFDLESGVIGFCHIGGMSGRIFHNGTQFGGQDHNSGDILPVHHGHIGSSHDLGIAGLLEQTDEGKVKSRSREHAPVGPGNSTAQIGSGIEDLIPGDASGIVGKAHQIHTGTILPCQVINPHIPQIAFPDRVVTESKRSLGHGPVKIFDPFQSVIQIPLVIFQPQSAVAAGVHISVPGKSHFGRQFQIFSKTVGRAIDLPFVTGTFHFGTEGIGFFAPVQSCNDLIHIGNELFSSGHDEGLLFIGTEIQRTDLTVSVVPVDSRFDVHTDIHRFQVFKVVDLGCHLHLSIVLDQADRTGFLG